ncbi:MAG: hypothetical protein ACK44F_09345 [Roseococcus sp.]
MRVLLAGLPFLALLGCAEPAVLRQGPGAASMERAEGVPLPRLVEPTGQGRITLSDPAQDDPRPSRLLQPPRGSR